MRFALLTLATLTALSTAACGPLPEAGEGDDIEVSLEPGKSDGVPISLDTGSGDVTIPTGPTISFPSNEPSTTITFPSESGLTVSFPQGTVVTIPGYPPITVGWATFSGDTVTIPYYGKRMVVRTYLKPQALKINARLALPAGKLYWTARAYVALHTKGSVRTAWNTAPVAY